jgi:hypothetical protein
LEQENVAQFLCESGIGVAKDGAAKARQATRLKINMTNTRPGQTLKVSRKKPEGKGSSISHCRRFNSI